MTDLKQLNMSLEGRVALVTGGTRGIGAAIAAALARAGAMTIITGRDETAGRAIVAAIAADGGEASYLRCDLSSDAEVERLIPAAVAGHGKLDVLVNNAGIDRQNLALETDMDDWHRIIRLNLEVPFRLSRAFAAHVIGHEGNGSIINISSVLGQIGGPGEAPYVQSKHGLNGLTRTLAIEWASKGVRVNAIAPGLIRTEMSRFLWEDPATQDRINARFPIRRIGEPEDFAGIAVLLASDAASFIHGQIIAVDGGRTAG